MITPVRLEDRINALQVLHDRGAHTPEDEVSAAFATLGTGDFRDCGVFLGSFDGVAGWERHMKGDELVHVLSGATDFDIIIDDDRSTLELTAGSLLVVPQGCWHRFRSETGVTVLTATPLHDEEHTFVDDPREL